jgi:4a-hydroxytetrahydrobiopterin dehydratase
MVAPLNPSELSAALAELPQWSGDGTGISRTVQAETFLAGIDLVAEVARMAEDMNHHPDIDIRWRNVTFGLVTHSAGGVTSLDIDLAKRIDAAAG